jgi:opacity protein-like surface antigen
MILSVSRENLLTETIMAIKLPDRGGGVIGTADVQSGGLMFNGYYDLKISSSITPFLGVGAGFSFVDIDKDIDDYDKVFAYQFIAGVGFDIHNKLKLDLAYKYFATTTPSFEYGGINYDLDYGTHSLQIGLRYYSSIF